MPPWMCENTISGHKRGKNEYISMTPRHVYTLLLVDGMTFTNIVL